MCTCVVAFNHFNQKTKNNVWIPNYNIDWLQTRKAERKRDKQKSSINGPLFTNRQLLLSHNNQHHMQERPLPFASVRHKWGEFPHNKSWGRRRHAVASRRAAAPYAWARTVGWRLGQPTDTQGWHSLHGTCDLAYRRGAHHRLQVRPAPAFLWPTSVIRSDEWNHLHAQDSAGGVKNIEKRLAAVLPCCLALIRPENRSFGPYKVWIHSGTRRGQTQAVSVWGMRRCPAVPGRFRVPGGDLTASYRLLSKFALSVFWFCVSF